MNKLVGASVYVGLNEYPLEENLKYLDILKELGVSHVFISSHIPEMNEAFLDELKTVLKYATSIGIKMIVDVNKNAFLELKEDLANAYAIRLDYGFSLSDIKELYEEGKFVLELNASTITLNKLEEMKSLGIDLSKIRLSHNFYPKKYTGLDRETVKEKNKLFKELGINIAIYIPSSNMKRPPMYDGLPTIEAHRYLDLDSILSEVDSLYCDEVIFGDSYASREELLQAINFDYSEVILHLRLNSDVTKEEKELIDMLHVNRTDANSYFVRSSIRSNNQIKPKNTTTRHIMDVTIDNIGMKRYMGEVCIVLKDIESDSRVNVIGKVVSSPDIVREIKPGRKFRFKIVE